MSKKSFVMTAVLMSCAMFYENHAMNNQGIRTITINYKGGYPSGNNKNYGGNNHGSGGGHGSHLQGVSTPWTSDKFKKAVVGATDVLPGATQSVPMGAIFVPNVADLTIRALQSLNSGQNSEMMDPGVRGHETVSEHGFVIPSDYHLKHGQRPYFRINDSDFQEVKDNKAAFNNCVEQAFNNQAFDARAYWFYAFVNLCKKRMERVQG